MPTALVTGCSSGIGLATCQLLTDMFWRVIGVDKSSIEKSDHISEFLQQDLSRLEEISALCSRLSYFGKFDLVVNNAGVRGFKSILETDLVEWDYIQKLNVTAPFLLVKGLYPFITRPGGSIVNVASIHTFATTENNAPYAASKSALDSLTRSMALEFDGVGIRTNSVLPGAIDTPFLRRGVVRTKVGTAEDVAEAIVFLGDGKRSGFINGQSIIIDGGLSTKLGK